MKNLSHLVIVAILLFSSVASANLYEQYNIPVPRPGEPVCRALIDKFSTISGYRICDNGCEQMLLPASARNPEDPENPINYCVRNRALDLSILPNRRLRVAWTGDIFTYQPDFANRGESHILDPSTSVEVCNARAFNTQGRRVSVRKLNSEMCYAGAEILYWNGEESQEIRIEVVEDTYLTLPDDSQVFRLINEINSGGNEGNGFAPATFSSDSRAVDI